MPKSEERTNAAERVGEAAKGLDPAAQLKLVERGLPDPDQATANLLWLIFVAGVLVLIGIFGRFVYQLIADGNTETDPALLSQVLTFLAGALVGLFVKSPVQSK